MGDRFFLVKRPATVMSADIDHPLGEKLQEGLADLAGFIKLAYDEVGLKLSI